MRITVVRNDNLIVVDGEPRKANLSLLPAFVHAIQWYGDYGILEIVDNDSDVDNDIIDNVRIVDFTDYNWIIEEYYSTVPLGYDVLDPNNDPNVKPLDDNGLPDTNPQ